MWFVPLELARRSPTSARPWDADLLTLSPLRFCTQIISQIIFLADQKAVCVGPALDHEMNEQTPRRPSADLLALASTCKTIRTIAKSVALLDAFCLVCTDCRLSCA